MVLKTETIQELGDAYTLSHPVRASIVKHLRKEKGYSRKIARDLGLSDRLVGFHLSILSKGGFVSSEYALSNPAKNPSRVVRYYSLTDKVNVTLKKFAADLT